MNVRIAEDEEHHRLMMEALADVDAGRVIDHRTIVAWVEGIGTRDRAAPLCPWRPSC